ncbi:MAG: hypothetical protein HYV97_09035 [Bdellovibrio sp.]|nr:hypothetical protein [Bdellovibrio sp.]
MKIHYNVYIFLVATLTLVVPPFYVNAMMINEEVAVLKLDDSRFKQELNSSGLSNNFDNVLNDGLNRNLILKYHPCLASIDQSQFEGYKSRLQRILFKKISAVDRRFAVAINPGPIAFTEDMKALASARLILRNSGRFNVGEAELLNVAETVKLDFNNVEKIDLSGFTATPGSGSGEDSTPKPVVFSADEKSFRATIGDHEQLFCEVYHDGKWKKIISAVSYLHTPCYELKVPKVRLSSDIEETEDEKGSSGGGCNPSKWKWHLIDLGWRLSLANGLVRETRRFDLLERAELERTIYNNHKLNLTTVAP